MALLISSSWIFDGKQILVYADDDPSDGSKRRVFRSSSSSLFHSFERRTTITESKVYNFTNPFNEMPFHWSISCVTIALLFRPTRLKIWWTLARNYSFFWDLFFLSKMKLCIFQLCKWNIVRLSISTNILTSSSA